MAITFVEVKMESNSKSKFLGGLKKYGYYILAFVLIAGITLSVVLTADKQAQQNTEIETETKPVVFGLPVSSPSVLKWYSDTELMYNETLKQWESHKALDIVSSDANDLNVYAVLDGTVTALEMTYEDGTILTITHDGGFVSKYYCLSDVTSLKVSDSVKKGDKIGQMSTTGANETKTGNHLHFELYKDGKKVDPANYLTLENK